MTSSTYLWASRPIYLVFLALCLCVIFSIFYEIMFVSPIIIIFTFLIVTGSSFFIYSKVDKIFERRNLEYLDEHAAVLAAVACAIGLIIRLSFVTSFPVFQFSDALMYWGLAERIANFGEYSSGGVPYAYRPPGLPLLLAGPIAIFGAQGWIPPAFNLSIYIASSLVLYRAAVALAGPVSGFVAVALFALFPGNIAVGSLALTEPVALLLLLCGFWAIINMEKRSSAIFVGLAFGYAALVRPTFLMLGPILVVFTLLQLFEKRRHLRQGALATVVFVLVLTPWVYRNYEQLGSFVPGSTMGGVNFYMANNPAAHTGIDQMDKDLFLLYPDEIERNRIGFKWGIEWIKDNPLDFIELTAKRFTRVAGKTSVNFNDSIKEKCQCDGTYYRVLKILDNIWWFLVWSLAFYALIKHKRIYEYVNWSVILFMMAGFSFAVHSVFIAVGRYHDPVAGLVLLVAVTAMSNSFAKRHLRERIAYVVNRTNLTGS